jgi:hypothetical protein
VKLVEKFDPRIEASARALGYYDRTQPTTETEWREHLARRGRLYFWLPAEAFTELPTAEERTHPQYHQRVRALSLETRLLWALAVSQAQAVRKEAEAYSAATRGLFRHRLQEMGFYAPDPVERALRAFLAGKRVDVEHKLNEPSRLLVDGKLVARNIIATNLRLTPGVI